MGSFFLRRWAWIIFAGATFAAGLAQAADPTPAFVETRDCRFRSEAIVCGTIAVPENRFASQGRTIRLNIIVLRAPGERAGHKSPVLVLDGGPGSDSRDLVYSISRTGDLAASRDLIFVAQRGVAGDNALCPDHWEDIRRIYGEALTEQESAAAEEASIKECFDALRSKGRDLAGYTNFQSALDLIDVRHALGVSRWSVWAFSYGTALAQELARLDGDAVEAMALDGVVRLDENWLFGLAEGHKNAWTALADRCQAEPSCTEDYGDIYELRRAAIASLKAAPYPLPNWRGQEGAYGSAEYYDVETGLFELLYDSSSHELIPLLLKSIVDRDHALMDRMAHLLSPNAAIDYGLFYAVFCSFPRSDKQALLDHIEANREWLLSPEAFKDVYRFCNDLGIAESPISASARPITAPTLMLSGALDPITPPSNAALAAEGFANASLLTVQSEAHIASSSDCGARAVEAFFNDPSVAPRPTCAAAPLALTVAPSDATPGAPNWLGEIEAFGVREYLDKNVRFPLFALGFGLLWAVRTALRDKGLAAIFIALASAVPTAMLIGAVSWAVATVHVNASTYPTLMDWYVGYVPLWANWPIWLAPAGLIAAALTFIAFGAVWVRASAERSEWAGALTLVGAAQLWLALALVANGLAPLSLEGALPWLQALT